MAMLIATATKTQRQRVLGLAKAGRILGRVQGPAGSLITWRELQLRQKRAAAHLGRLANTLFVPGRSRHVSDRVVRTPGHTTRFLIQLAAFCDATRVCPPPCIAYVSKLLYCAYSAQHVAFPIE